MKPQRGTVKKVVLVIAGATFTCAVLSLGLALWAWMTYGKHVYTSSLVATTFFFVTAAIVLYEMSRPKQALPPPEEQPPIDPPRTFT
jgi:hypothetical protein